MEPEYPAKGDVQPLVRVFATSDLPFPHNNHRDHCTPPTFHPSAMTPSYDSFIDDLLAHRTITGRTVKVPGFENLNEFQQARIIARLREAEERGELIPDFDQGPLEAALSCLTPPPPSKEQLIIEARGLEIKARQDLEAEGCPPCYPPDLKIPLRNIPQKYQRIIAYWELSGAQYAILMAQFRDWEEFREFQKRVRYDYGTLERPFSEYVDRVRKRRQRHGLEGDVPLRFSLEEKDRRLENWIEFQAFHIRFSIEPLEKKISGQKAAMDSLQKKADSADATVSKKAAETIKFNQPAWKYQEQKLEMERYFLQWTEQKRVAMDPGYPSRVEVDRDDRVALSKAVRMASVSDRRKRQPKARSVLGEPRISKQKQDVRRKPKMLDTVPTPPAMDSSPPTSNVSRIPDSPATKSQRIKTRIPRRQPLLQKVSKAKQFDNTNTKSVAASRRRAIEQKRSSDAQSLRRSQPAMVEATTRSGRISRLPLKWVPA